MRQEQSQDAEMSVVLPGLHKWEICTFTTFLIGTVSAFFITTITPTTIETSPLIVFLSGMIAICAMILPGISGSFILLLLGMYAPMLIAVKELQLATLCIFAIGCVAGLLSFQGNKLMLLLQYYRNYTQLLTLGSMVGPASWSVIHGCQAEIR